MSSHIGLAEISHHFQSNHWKSAFSTSVAATGRQIARARQVTHCQGEHLDTGDTEIIAQVIEKSGHQHEVTLALWMENETIQLDTSCTCAVRTCCEHAAAVIEHLARPGRLESAFGELAEKPNTKTLTEAPQAKAPTSATFHLHIQKRPPDDAYLWLPELYATAKVNYGDTQHPLDPSGNITPPRDRATEMNALNTLYTLDLLPGAEEPPHSLKKIAQPDTSDGTLWAPDKKQWQPSIYWQRFRHDVTPTLEKHGWKITFAHDTIAEPLRFNASTFKTEFIDEGRGWFSLSAGFEIDGEPVDLQPILTALVDHNFLDRTQGMPEGQEFLVFLPDGRALTLPVGRFHRILTHLGELMDYQFTGKPIRMHKIEAAQVLEQISSDLASPATPEVITSLTTQNRKLTTHNADIPSALQATLREYQAEGFQWMQFLANNDLHGILADDMGLGKTMQTLTHILAEKEKGNTHPCLVIAPTSVVENWQREAAKFAPSLKVTILQGADRHQRFAQLPNTDVALTSYALLHRDLEHFSTQDFHLLILDEAQHIKNPSAQVSQAVRQLNARHRICLSGTPIENHLGELWSLFDFLMPELLGDAETFRETFRNPIEKNKDQKRADALATKVGPLILRRTKDQVATELPPKTEIPHYIELAETEKDLYETVRSTMDKHVRRALASKTGQQAQIVFLDALLKLRQICCHPTLVEQASKVDDTDSSKFSYLAELLETLKKENRKVLLFSQFTSMLDIIEQHLVQTNTTYLKLTGASKNRQEMVEQFQSGAADVFLISLKAGGTGLTLTNADTVIHYDPWWNPAAENQATDRAYRIGQDKPVFVHKLICKDTVEQRIQQMQERKSHISDSILTASLNQLKLDDDILTQLLSPIEPTHSTDHS